MLYIDGQLIADNDGVHSTTVRLGSIRLAGGAHTIRIPYFQGPGDTVALMLEVAGPGEPSRIFSTAAGPGTSRPGPHPRPGEREKQEEESQSRLPRTAIERLASFY